MNTRKPRVTKTGKLTVHEDGSIDTTGFGVDTGSGHADASATRVIVDDAIRRMHNRYAQQSDECIAADTNKLVSELQPEATPDVLATEKRVPKSWEWWMVEVPHHPVNVVLVVGPGPYVVHAVRAGTQEVRVYAAEFLTHFVGYGPTLDVPKVPPALLKPERRPWTVDEVSRDAWYRREGNTNPDAFRRCTGIDKVGPGVVLWNAAENPRFANPRLDMLAEFWEHSIDGGATWHPCSVPV